MANEGFRLVHIETYLSGGHVKYASILEKSSESAFTAYHGRTADQHHPTNVSAVAPNGIRTYAGLYEKRDVGSFYVKSFLKPAEYQPEFTENMQAGRRLAYLNAYNFSGEPRIIAIWHEKPRVACVCRPARTHW